MLYVNKYKKKCIQHKFTIHVQRTYLCEKSSENLTEKESDLYFVDNSTTHPIRRPRAPITITRTTLEDLHNSPSINMKND